MNYYTTKCINFFKTKRSLLLLIPLETLFLILFYNKMYVRYYVLNCSFILFYNFPDLLISLHKKPVYYEDLIITTYLHDECIFTEQTIDKYKLWYQNIFKWVILITSPILCSLLTDIWFIKTAFINAEYKSDIKYLNPSTAAALAIIFSLTSLYIKLSIIFGSGLIKVLKFVRSYNIKRNIKNLEKKINIELVSVKKSAILRRNSKSVGDFSNGIIINPLTNNNVPINL